MTTYERRVVAWASRASPLVAREMRVSARRWTTYWGRVTVVLFAAIPLVVVVVMVGLRGLGLGQVGGEVLKGQAILLFVWVTVSVLQAADSISFEKREGTLGLLFLANVTPLHLLLGKMAAASMRSWHGLLAAVPALSLPVLLGGATLGDCLRLALVLADGLFVGLAVTMLVSTCCRREHSAAGGAVLALGALCGAIPLAQACGAQSPILEHLNLANPIAGLWTFPESVYQNQSARYWATLAATHLLGWLVLGVTSVVLPRVWQDRPANSRGGHWRIGWRQWVLGKPESRRRFRTAALERNPMFWYVSREQRTWWMPWAFLALSVVGVIVLPLIWPNIAFTLPGTLFVCWCVQLVYKQWVGSTTSRVFARQTDGAVELVLATALAERDLVTGPLRAVARRFAGPILAVAILEVLFVTCGTVLTDHQERRWWPVLVPLHLGTFLLDLVTVSVMGLWQGVVARNASQAVSGTNWWVLLMPWAVIIGSLVLGLMSKGQFGTADALLTWFVASVIIDAVCLRWAWKRLNANLRLTVFDRFAGGEPWLNGWRELSRLLTGVWSSSAAQRRPLR